MLQLKLIYYFYNIIPLFGFSKELCNTKITFSIKYERSSLLAPLT